MLNYKIISVENKKVNIYTRKNLYRTQKDWVQKYMQVENHQETILIVCLLVQLSSKLNLELLYLILQSSGFSLMPFSAGRRVCLGENLARERLFLFASCLLQYFTIHPPDQAADKPLSCDPRHFELGLILEPRPFQICAIPRHWLQPILDKYLL